jgi:hypothetical protein
MGLAISEAVGLGIRGHFHRRGTAPARLRLRGAKTLRFDLTFSNGTRPAVLENAKGEITARPRFAKCSGAAAVSR